jgi:glutaconyl-CoA decarboxylase
MGHPVTTNPFIIMLINMAIVFAVLMGLSAMIRLIHLCDPTAKAKEEKKPAAAPKAAPAAAPAAAPKADNSAVIAVIAAAVAAYDSEARIVTVRPIESTVWKNNARATALNNTVC